MFALANCLKNPFPTLNSLSWSSSDCSVTASKVRFLFPWLDAVVAATPGAGGGGVDDLVLPVLLLFGFCLPSSGLPVEVFVVFNAVVQVVCLLAGASSATALRFLQTAIVCW